MNGNALLRNECVRLKAWPCPQKNELALYAHKIILFNDFAMSYHLESPAMGCLHLPALK